MSNRRQPPAGRRPPAKSSAPNPGRRTLPVLLAVAALAAVLLVVAIVATRGGNDDDAAPVGVEQTRPVTITGNSLPQFDSAAGDPAVGLPAPDVRGASFDGTSVTVGDGPAVLMFLAHWCPHCQREVPLIVDHLAAQPPPAGVEIVAVATSTTSSRPNYPPSEWLAREGLDVPALADDDSYSVAAAYGLGSFPYFVAVDEDGNVAMRASGELATEEFDKLVAAALGGSSR